MRRIWRPHGLTPHLLRTCKISRDPAFAETLEATVGPYLAPPEHALVLCVGEKSQIQALDRTQPGLPLKRGHCGTMTHDYEPNGAATLFAALNTLDGTAISMCNDRQGRRANLAIVVSFAFENERATPTHRRPRSVTMAHSSSFAICKGRAEWTRADHCNKAIGRAWASGLFRSRQE